MKNLMKAIPGICLSSVSTCCPLIDGKCHCEHQPRPKRKLQTGILARLVDVHSLFTWPRRQTSRRSIRDIQIGKENFFACMESAKYY